MILVDSITDTAKKYNGVSDFTGNFLIKNLDTGNYRLTVSFISYRTISRDLYIGRDTIKMVKIGSLQLLLAKNILKEVKVTAERPFMTVEPDKTVFDADKISAVSSGTASDLLAQIPLVNIDQSGNVMIRGQAAGVLIDGKPSSYTDLTTALEMIPATSIDRVEVMTTPSAKYDASGQGGMVNIILKQNVKSGLEGVVNLDAGSQPDEHVGTDLHYRNKHWNVFGNVNYHHKSTDGLRTSEQYFPASNTQLTQLTNSKTTDRDIDGRLGVEYLFNDKTNLTLTQNIGDHRRTGADDLTIDSGQYQTSPSSYGSGSNRTATSDHVYSSTLDFSRRFAKDGEEFSASAQYAVDDNSTSNSLFNNTGSFYQNLLNSGTGRNKSFLLQSDFADPVGKTGKIEFGYKGTWLANRNISNAYSTDDITGNYLYNNSLSTNFSYNQQVQAIYGLYSGTISTFNYKLGVRTELETITGQSYLTDAAINETHLNSFPSLYLSKNINDDAEIRKVLMKDRLTIAAMVSDIFNQREQNTHIIAAQFIEHDLYKEDSRILHLHLSYSF